MSHKEIPRAGLLKAALAGKISNRVFYWGHSRSRSGLKVQRQPSRTKCPGGRGKGRIEIVTQLTSGAIR
jgi:hypothetical protein